MSIVCSNPPVIGTGGFSLGGGFAFPRSYISYVRVGWINSTISQNDNEFTGGGTFVPPTAWKLVIKPEVFSWNSNGYTLDHIVCESFYLRLLTGEKIPAPYAVVYEIDPITVEAGLLIYNQDGGFPFTDTFVLPPAPPGYWINDPN